MDNIKTFALFPDKRFKYGGIAYIGSPDMSIQQLRQFIVSETFASYAKNKKLRKCFDYADIITVGYNAAGKRIYVAGYRFYPPFLWSNKKIIKALEESFDECIIE